MRLFPWFLRITPTFVAVTLAILAQGSGLFDSFNNRLQDTLTRLTPSTVDSPTKSVPDVAVVTIDPRSLRTYDDWPWPRSRHAEAVDQLTEAGAVAIAFDIDFSSASNLEEDLLFAQSLRRNQRVVLATFSQFQNLDAGAELEIVNRPIESLEAAAAGLGSVLVPIDSDGVVRHAPRTSPIGATPIPSLARAALLAAASPDQRERIAGLTHSNQTTQIDFRRALPEIPTISYTDLLTGAADTGAVKGRVVFIGATAAEFQDLWSTPVSAALPGVFIQAVAYRTAAAEFAGDTTVQRLPEAWSICAFIVLAALLFPRSGSNRLHRFGAVLMISTSLCGLAWMGLWKWGYLVPMSVPLILVASLYALGIESLQKRIESRAAAQESSLSVLARIGTQSPDAKSAKSQHADTKNAGLELALELLGEVVHARGIVLLSSTRHGRLTQERLEWRPAQSRSSLTRGRVPNRPRRGGGNARQRTVPGDHRHNQRSKPDHPHSADHRV